MLLYLMNMFILLFLVVTKADAGNIFIQPTPVNNEVTANIGSQFGITCSSTGSAEDKPKALEWRTQAGDVITRNPNNKIYTKLDGDQLRLIFSVVSADDSGTYTCSGIESGQPKEVSFELVLKKQISFGDTRVEQSILANTNQEQLIICKAEAIPGPSIYWLRNNHPIDNNDSEIVSNTLSYIENDEKYQITNDGLIVRNVQTEDEGTYICQAMVTSTGEAKSLKIQVNVITIPKWVQEPKDAEGVRGQDVILKCDASGKPAPRITFMKDGIGVAGERYLQQGSMLTIRRLENSDSSTYKCMAENLAGTIEATFRLTVLVGPVIAPMDSVVVRESSKASLKCNVIEAFPAPVFRWKYTDTQQFIDTSHTNGNITMVNNDLSSELRFENVQRLDKRNYTCVATNKAAVTEAVTSLFVQYPPVFIMNNDARRNYYSWIMTDQNQNSRGETVVMTCIADAYPPALLKWYLDGRAIEGTGPKFRLLRDEPGYTQLEINPSDEADFKTYTCKAENSIGSDSLIIQLLKATPPKYAPTVEKGPVKPDSFIITIKSPQGTEADGGMPIQTYRVQWRLAGSDWTKPFEVSPQVNPLESNKDILDYEVKQNIMPNTEYVVRVAAVNKPGTGQWSPELSIQTPPRRQPDPVRVLSREDCGYTSRCVVEWTPEGNGGAPIKEYYIRWRRIYYKDLEAKYKNSYDPWSRIVQLPVGQTRYEIKNLAPNSFYEVDINAINEIGLSASQPYRIRTLQGAQGQASEYIEPKRISNFNLGLIIGGAILSFLFVLLIIDLCCYFTNKCGIIMSVKDHCTTSKKSKNIERPSKSEKPMYGPLAQNP